MDRIFTIGREWIKTVLKNDSYTTIYKERIILHEDHYNMLQCVTITHTQGYRVTHSVYNIVKYISSCHNNNSI